MTTKDTERPIDRAWLERMADAEDQCESVSVGGLACDFGNLRSARPKESPVTKAALGKLIELSRRDRGLSREDLARRADIDLAELLSIERGEIAHVEPYTVTKLAQALELPTSRLMELAGFSARRDRRLDEAAVHFAASSEPVDKLSVAEQQALQEFVDTLAALAD